MTEGAPGAFLETILERASVGAALLDAGQTPRGRQMLTLWKLTGFEPVPADYAQTLADIVRAYPPPARLVRTSAESATPAPR